MIEARHDSVLLSEVVKALDVQENDVVVDATIGGAGHFSALLSSLGADGVIIGIDADSSAVERARGVYALDRRADRPTAHLITDNFRNLARILERLGIGGVNKIFFDLGWSGYQLAEQRGFSFMNDEPLLMTYGEGGPANGLGTGETAADIVNTYSEQQLADLIYTYGEERFSRSIARAIVDARRKERILTTGALVKVVEAGTPRWYRARKIHPATKTFQALRIAVNDEFAALREGLTQALDALAPNGRLAIISFHSSEDRIVKNILRGAADRGLGALSPKKTIVPTRAEILANHRARSAKLRVFWRAEVLHQADSIESRTQLLSYA